MAVKIKKFNVDMEIKNKGIELEIRSPGGDFLGDIIISKTGIEWCGGKTAAGNGIKLKWDEYIELVEKH